MLKIPAEKHQHNLLAFPSGFLWGAATSAYQVEGNNIYSNWWEWEKDRDINYRSGQAADQYNRYLEDIELAKSLEHNAHRLSIEWSRIEPEEGLFNEEVIDHYCDELKTLKLTGMKVMLTIWHFTLPKWISDQGGWENSRTEFYFLRFIEKVIPSLKDYVDFYITINEPGVFVYTGYLTGIWPPQKKSKLRSLKIYWRLAQAHKKAYHLLHRIDDKAKVGIANNIASFGSFHKHSLLEQLTVWVLDIFGNHLFYKLSGVQTHDFLGLNYYFHHWVSFNGQSQLPSLVDVAITKKDTSDMGWEVNPEGIFDVLLDFSDYHLPIYITENGMASTNDDRRCRMMISYLKEIYHAIQSGADVKGYFHWSLIDNFEWADGFDPRFGLVEIDYNTQKRTPRPSAYVYADIIRNNGIPHHILRFIGHTVEAEEVLAYDHVCIGEHCKHLL